MKLSIIVPVYNTKKYLKKCLNSLVKQTLKDIEIIVINDGSKENVDAIIKKYQKQIIYIKNDNHGIGYTRNLGIKKAKGEYIGFVDSDDYVEQNMYADYYEFAKKENLDIVVGNYYKHENNIKQKMILNHFNVGNIYNNPKILIDIDYGPCNKIFKKDFILKNKINFEETLKYEDMPFVIKSLKSAEKIGHLEKGYYNYIVRNSSQTTTNDQRNLDIFKVFNIINDYFKKEKDLKEEIAYLNISKLLDYNILQRKQKDHKIRNEFIDKTFDYLNKNFSDFKLNKYFKKENIFKRIIKQNKIITKFYCFVYVKTHRI